MWGEYRDYVMRAGRESRYNDCVTKFSNRIGLTNMLKARLEFVPIPLKPDLWKASLPRRGDGGWDFLSVE